MDFISRNMRSIAARGQSQPVAMACLNIRTSTGLSNTWISSRTSSVLSSESQTARRLFSRVIPYFSRRIRSTFSISFSSSAFVFALSHGIWMSMSGLRAIHSALYASTSSLRFASPCSITISSPVDSRRFNPPKPSLITTSFLIIPASIGSCSSTRI